MWTVKFQMFKLVSEKAEEPEIKHCQHPLDHRKSKRVSEKHLLLNVYFCFSDYAKAFDCVDHNKLWKILKEMGIPDHMTCLLRNLYAGQEATVKTEHGTTDWFQIGKGVCQGCILSPCLFNLYAEGNGNPLQCSCLENPRDGGTWWAAIYGVAQSQTRLKQLSSSSRVHHKKCWAGWSTSWNQDFWKKYQ